MATGTASPTVLLLGLPAGARLRSLAYVSSAQEIVTRYRHIGGLADPALDPAAFVHDLARNLARSLDLSASAHVQRILSVNYLRLSDELLFFVIDDQGVRRLLITDRTGTPRRSARTDALPDLVHLAPITSGPNAGDVGTISSQPASFARITLP